MNALKYYIAAESYDENVGGHIVLHKLCDQINRAGGEAYLVPAIRSYFISQNNFVKPLLKFAKERLRRAKRFQTNPAFMTPVATWDFSRAAPGDVVMIYPEAINGNPFRAAKVVRWLLHHPGFHSPEFYYGTDELYFKYHSGIVVPKSMQANTVEIPFTISHYPVEHYNLEGVSAMRSGTAYALRKGKGRRIVHDLTDSILIDNMSHAEAAQVFKRVKTFINYDLYSTYSAFAALCGCDSVVVPEENVSAEQWHPNRTLRLGVAYGFEQIETARAERDLLIKRVAAIADDNVRAIERFFDETRRFFRE